MFLSMLYHLKIISIILSKYDDKSPFLLVKTLKIVETGPLFLFTSVFELRVVAMVALIKRCSRAIFINLMTTVSS